jgi:hypothetical protein
VGAMNTDENHSDPVTKRVVEDNARVNSPRPLGWALLLACLILIAAASFYSFGDGPEVSIRQASAPTVTPTEVGARASH